MQPPDPKTFNPEFPPRFCSWPHFSRVFMISAIKDDGINDLRTFLEERSRFGVWNYRPEFISTHNPKALAEDIARERLLDNLRDEVSWVFYYDTNTFLIIE